MRFLRKEKKKVDDLRSERNKISAEINKLMKDWWTHILARLEKKLEEAMLSLSQFIKKVMY